MGDKIVIIFVLIMLIILFIPFILYLRFCTPIKLRIKYPKWDKFLCKIGSHRCINICGMGCCWECVRCKAEEEGKLDEHYNKIKELIKKEKVNED